MFNKKVSLEALKPFGCQCFTLIPPHKRGFKLNPTAQKGLFLGYENDFSSYKILIPDSKMTLVTRNLSWNENIFPGTQNWNTEGSEDAGEEDEQLLRLFDVINPQLKDTSLEMTASPIESAAISSEPLAPHNISSDISTDNILSVDRRGNAIVVYFTQINSEKEPKTYIQAINSPQSSFWKKAIEKEINNMENHDVWCVVKKTPQQKKLNATWVFKIKKDEFNVPTEYKGKIMCSRFPTNTWGGFLQHKCSHWKTGLSQNVNCLFFEEKVKISSNRH